MGIKLLVANNDQEVASTVKSACQRLGVDDITYADDGKRLKQHLDSQPYDMYVLNQSMHGVSGLELTRAIRESQPDAPVMLVSEQVGAVSNVEAVKAGVSDFLLLPINPKELATKFKTWFKILGFDAEKLLAEEKPAPKPKAVLSVEYINPFLSSVTNTFSTMFNCKMVRKPPYRIEIMQPPHEVSGVIELFGRAKGKVVICLSRELAMNTATMMLGEPVETINADLRDAVGELANIITGGAKSRLEELQLRVGLPEVLIGRTHTLTFPKDAVPLALPFSSAWGEMTVMFGLAMNDEEE